MEVVAMYVVYSPNLLCFPSGWAVRYTSQTPLQLALSKVM